MDKIQKALKKPNPRERKTIKAILSKLSSGKLEGLEILQLKLEVEIRFYLRNPKLTILDLDNRLKDVLDALQGMIGEKGKSGKLKAIIPNDNQVYRLIAEKRLAPKANREALSTIVIRRYDHHGGTARSPRDTRKHVQ